VNNLKANKRQKLYNKILKELE